MSDWKPELGETYYVVTHWLRVSENIWGGWSGEQRLLEVGNCFRTKEEAEAKLEKIKAIFKNQQITENRPKLTVEVFDREDCPDWAKWVALSRGGILTFYEDKPRILKEGYTERWVNFARWYTIAEPKFDASDWKNSLVKRPRKLSRLPDWVTVDAHYYDTSNGVFKKITEADLENIAELKQLIEFGIYREVRCEVLATDKLEALIGKVLQHKNGYKALVCSYDAKTNLVYMGHYTVTPEVLKTSWTIDGKPCCKMLYWSHRSGTWIEPC